MSIEGYAAQRAAVVLACLGAACGARAAVLSQSMPKAEAAVRNVPTRVSELVVSDVQTKGGSVIALYVALDKAIATKPVPVSIVIETYASEDEAERQRAERVSRTSVGPSAVERRDGLTVSRWQKMRMNARVGTYVIDVSVHQERFFPLIDRIFDSLLRDLRGKGPRLSSADHSKSITRLLNNHGQVDVDPAGISGVADRITDQRGSTP